MQHRRLESGGVRRDRSARCVLSRRWRGQAAATYCSSGSRQAVLFCSPLLVACACLLVSYCASSTEPVHVPYPGNGDQLDPARRFERDAVGRELVSRASRAVPAAPDGLGRPGRGKLRRRSLVAGRALPFYIERVVSEALFSVPPYGF